jgi:2-keto-4-pentenoate hydratase/2-oxohepta-3-ene-1,7-dioic acid hydratase in catechol pathway
MKLTTAEDAHAREFSTSGFEAGAKPAEAIPTAPIIFSKPWTSISGPGDDIPLWPGVEQAVDYEGELAGKALDGFAPMGPWIVTADVSTLIAVISRGMMLLPGDIIATGTPEGVGIGFRPPKFLRDGDVVEVAISGVGSIRNVARTAAPRG